MPNTFELIASNTSYAGGTTLTFSSIPSTFTDICLVMSPRGNGFNGTELYLTFNGNTSSYSGKYMWKDGGTTSITSGNNNTSNSLIGIIPGTQAGSNVYGSVQVYVPNYASSSNKSFGVESASERNGDAQWLFLGAGLWSNSSAITSVTITASANYLGDSTAYLYGIKKD
jgi:predicted heme/steroid binding protein